MIADAANITWALRLAKQGLPCFPCQADKRPATPQGFKDATGDFELVKRLWSNYPGPLIGVPTGKISGIAILDIDPRHGGGAWFAEHRNRIPSIRVHRTGSGGLHLIFQHRKGLRCSVGKVGAGIDVRANGGYVIWWPAAGRPVLSESPPAPWPDWINPTSVPQRGAPAAPFRVPDNHAIARLIRVVSTAPAGARNSLTFWAGCRIGEMVGTGLLEARVAAKVIAEAATRAGLSYSEAERTAWSGIRTTAGASRA
jgi:Bifunctional DNA primase/polymerase, N-terminal